MPTFKNKNFTKRDYECTNLVYCVADKAPDENWIECDPSENTLSPLWIADGVQYFGYL